MCVNVLRMLVLMGILCLSCGDRAGFSKIFPTNIAETNDLRRTLGLRCIKPEEWEYYGTEFRAEKWRLRGVNDPCKMVQYGDNGSILWEEDYYYSGATYLVPPDNETSWEHLTISYDYRKQLLTMGYSGSNESIMSRVDPFTPPNRLIDSKKTSNEELFTVADDILSQWGLKRL
jgi:hypothetical protein